MGFESVYSSTPLPVHSVCFMFVAEMWSLTFLLPPLCLLQAAMSPPWCTLVSSEPSTKTNFFHILLLIFFNHSNGKIISTHLFFQLFVNPAYLNAKMPQVYGVIGDSPLTRSAGLSWDLGLSISHEFPGNPEAAGPQCTLWDTLLWADFSPPDFIFKFQPSHNGIKYHN